MTSGIYKSFSDIPDEYETLQSKHKKQMIKKFIEYQDLEASEMVLDIFPPEKTQTNNTTQPQILPLTN